jgi:hypothetical protein
MEKLKLILALSILLVLMSCNDSKKNQIESNEIDISKNQNDSTELIELTEKWNNLLVKQKLEELKEMYAEQVYVYGYSISKEQVISNKKDFLEKYSDFNQSIIGNIEIKKIKENQYKLVFPKRTNYNNKTFDVEGYLIFEKISGKWKIINESDNQTDKNVTNNQKKEKKKLKNCSAVVEEILVTSPRYKELTNGLYEAVVKNGGISFGITYEGSPNPVSDKAIDYSETYDFNLHESYYDRSVVIARFSFNLTQRQLFEYDVINDNLKIIDFDRDLLLELNKLCD